MTPKGIIAGVLLVLFFIVLGQNTDVVTLRFLVWKLSMSRIVLMLLSLFVGVIIGFVAARLTGSSHPKSPKFHKP
jgi:uncharacterized integral membrane protein